MVLWTGDALRVLARWWLLYLTTCQSKSNDGGHVTSKVTIPMMASVDTGIFGDRLRLVTYQAAQREVNGGILSFNAERLKRHAMDRSMLWKMERFSVDKRRAYV
jgi:hypothetical protein